MTDRTAEAVSYPPPQKGTWTLTAPDGRVWTGTSPLDLARKENAERVPAVERLRRLFRGIHEWLEQGIRLRGDGRDLVVEIEHDGKFIEVIREFHGEVSPICHIVEPSGINSKIIEALSSDRRSELQREADAMDCDLYRIICRAEALAERIRVAGPHLRNYANALSKARHHVRCLMHIDDREKTRGY